MLFSSELIKGTLRNLILKALKSTPRMNEYELVQHVKEYIDNSMPFHEGDLYPILQLMEAQGIVTAETENIGNRTRKYYSRIHSGTWLLRKKVTEIIDFFRTLNFLLYNEPQFT